MLRQDVIDAVEAHQFHICTIEHINDALSLLSGIDAGEADENGIYLETTFNASVVK